MFEQMSKDNRYYHQNSELLSANVDDWDDSVILQVKSCSFVVLADILLFSVDEDIRRCQKQPQNSI